MPLYRAPRGGSLPSYNQNSFSKETSSSSVQRSCCKRGVSRPEMPRTGLWALPLVFWSLTSTWVVAGAGKFQLRSSPLPIAGCGLKLSGRGVVDGAAGSLGWAVGVGKHRVAHQLLSRVAATEPWPVAGEHLLDEGLCGDQPVALRLRGGGLLRNPEKINKVRKMCRTSGKHGCIVMVHACCGEQSSQFM